MSMTEPTVSEHLRNGMQNLLAGTLEDVAERAVDKAFARRDAAAQQPIIDDAPAGAEATNGSGMPLIEAVATLSNLVAQLIEDRNALKVELAKVKEAMANNCNVFVAELGEVKAELAECLRSGGVWNATTTYPLNAVVTDHSKLWQARRANQNDRPPSDAWRLMHHKGL